MREYSSVLLLLFFFSISGATGTTVDDGAMPIAQDDGALTIAQDDGALPIAQPRVVGGKDVFEGEYPSFAFTADSTLCGGTLIHEDIILTAAHCYGAWEGGAYIGGISVFATGSSFSRVDTEYQHPDYDIDTYENDIMLVKLTKPSRAPIETLNFDPLNPSDGSTLTVIGYGATAERGKTSATLLEADVNAIGFEECNAFWGRIDDETMLCAGVPQGGKDSCQGDSGGPMYDENKVQVGITSFGEGCGRPDTPSVYTRVSGYEDFILEGICDLSANPPSTCDPSSFPTTTTVPSDATISTLSPTVSSSLAASGSSTSSFTSTAPAGSVTPVALSTAPTSSTLLRTQSVSSFYPTLPNGSKDSNSTASPSTSHSGLSTGLESATTSPTTQSRSVLATDSSSTKLPMSSEDPSVFSTSTSAESSTIIVSDVSTLSPTSVKVSSDLKPTSSKSGKKSSSKLKSSKNSASPTSSKDSKTSKSTKKSKRRRLRS